MRFQFELEAEYGVEEIEPLFPDRVKLASFGSGSMLSELYYLPSEQLYVKKGAYATHESICYMLCDFNDEAGANAWIARQKAYWDRQPKLEEK